MTNDQIDLDMVAASTRDLPALHAVALKALEMTHDPNISARELQSVIAADASLSARILKIVNSALYGLRSEISTLRHAIAILGLNTTRSVLMAACIETVFGQAGRRRRDLASRLLAEHSWGAAVACRTIARRVGYPDPEEAFVCGLMHDIGKPVLLDNFPTRYNEIFQSSYRGEERAYLAEFRAFGFTHAHVGALLAKKWNFPAQLAGAIGYHHTPLAAPEHIRLACITSLANSAMIFMEIGVERDNTLELWKDPSAEYLRLGQQALAELLAEVRSGFELFRASYNR